MSRSLTYKRPTANSLLFCLTGLLLSTIINATIIPNSLFSNGMILQQGKQVPVWGTATDGEKITISFNGQLSTTFPVNGKWMLSLSPMKYSNKGITMTISGNDTVISIRNVLIGEVWLCSGQSNMYRTLGPQPSRPPVTNWEQEKAAANYPLIRQYAISPNYAAEKITDAHSDWQVCSPETVSTFSAVAYFFARDLYKDLQVPVGIVLSAFGGTPAEDWTSRDALEADPELKTFAENYPQIVSAGWQPKGQLISGLYNGMVHPLIPYAMAGVAWYQGEANNVRASQYSHVLSTLIKNWRKDFGQGDLPFLIVQIAPHKDMSPELREAQLLVSQQTNNTALIVTTDCGDPEDIHPAHKQPVGERLAFAARALAYHQKIVYAGPVLRSVKRRGSKIILYFSNSRSGLKSGNDQALKGFVITGDGKHFLPAKTELKGKSISVYHPGIRKPTAVRYGWSNVPDVNLYNRQGLPASPFRTDAPAK